MFRPHLLVLVVPLMLLTAGSGAVAQAPQTAPKTDGPGADLPYPPPGTPTPGEIDHVPTGVRLSFDNMMDMVAGSRLVYVGEAHDNLQAHQAELRIIEDLARRFPGQIAIGMEMFRQPQQAILDRWTQGRLSELQLLEATNWLKTWGFDFGYYRAILDFARDQHIDVVALDPPADLQAEVSRHGLDALPEALRSELPESGPEDPYERAAMQAVFGAHLPTAGAFDAFFRVQLLWEESMAQNVAGYLKSARGQGKRMVVLTGGWHVQYGYGVPKKVVRRLPLPYVVVMPTEIDVPAEKGMNVDMPPVPLRPEDFVWWVRYETLPASPVHLGVRIDDTSGAAVVQEVTKGSPAERSGLRVGDEIVAVAGHPVTNLTGVAYWVDKQEKGSSATVSIRRGGAPLGVRVEF